MSYYFSSSRGKKWKDKTQKGDDGRQSKADREKGVTDQQKHVSYSATWILDLQHVVSSIKCRY